LLRTFPATGDRGTCLAFSPTGRLIAAGYRSGRVRIWPASAPDGESPALDTGRAGVNGLAFSPDGRWLAAACADATIAVWDAATGRRAQVLGKPHIDPITCLAFSPNGRYLATGDKAGRIVFWSCETWRSTATLFPHVSAVYGLAISSDGAYLATASQDRAVKVFATSGLHFQLGRVRIVAQSSGFRLKVDGQPTGLDAAGGIALRPGPHEIAVSSDDGTVTRVYPVQVAADSETSVTVETRSALGRLIVSAGVPVDAMLATRPAPTPVRQDEVVERIKPGRYLLTVTPRDKRYGPQSVEVEIVGGETSRVRIAPRLAVGDPSPPPDAAAIGQTRINPRDGAEMIWIPLGESTIGSDTGDRDARPPHPVALRGFWIYRSPVSVAQYRRFCEATAATARPRRMPQAPRGGWMDSHPIVNVSWQDAVDYGRWAFGSDSGVFLPSEAQYERAMQGPSARQYPWGEAFDPAAVVCSVRPKQASGTAAIGGRAPNGWGLEDIAGNVWEWCATWYDPDRYRKLSEDDPSSGRYRCIRGGAWDSRTPAVFRTDYRGKAEPSARAPDLGFRCAAN
ncbi:MAG TPA: SUMF1/EgtB/PvdO family nonheme iron enzyme, partial [Chthonomonadaceae bacterium]|nr:SUMF1/EgtB/PvdO family nonheme iron enzyme [Chthonomonadaceae bacterium]